MICARWKLSRGLAVIAICLFFVVACGDDNGSSENNANGDASCHGGDAYVVDGDTYCVFPQSITEEGFSCPPDFAVGSSYGDLIICGEDGDVPDPLLDTIHEEYDQGLPLEPCLGITCPQSDVCRSGDCVERDCWEDDDCADGDSCATGECVTASESRVLIVSSARTSWQCTDSENSRFSAFQEAISTLVGEKKIPTATIRYSSWVHTTPFTTVSEEFHGFLDPAQGLGPASDLQGAIATAIDLIEADSDDDEDDHHYHIVFVDTTAPTPLCTDDCTDDSLGEFDYDSAYENGVCQADPEDIPDGHYVDFDAPCTDYNLFHTLSERLQELESAAPNMSIHFALTIDDEETIEGICGDSEASFFTEKTDSARQLFPALLSEVDAGGQFVDTVPADLDLLEILNL